LAGSIIALATVLTIFGVWIGNLKFDLPSSVDKVTRINTVVAASAYVAAIIAAAFALIAYWQTSGRPSLKPEVSQSPFRFSELEARSREAPPWIRTWAKPFPRNWNDYSKENADLFTFHWGEDPPKSSVPMLEGVVSNTFLTVTLVNRTKYTARNPGLRIQFDGLLFNDIPSGWTPVARWGESNGLMAIQWDGGIDNIVHGKWSRTLPIVGFDEVVVIKRWPELIMTVVADGCRPKEYKFPLKVRITGQSIPGSRLHK
jgi:hypothetical protein